MVKDVNPREKLSKSVNSPITEHTLNRLRALKPDSMFIDDFLNSIIDHYMGTDCDHKHVGLYLKLHVKDNGYLDTTRSLNILRDAHFGKGNPDIVEVCEDCLRMKRKFK